MYIRHLWDHWGNFIQFQLEESIGLSFNKNADRYTFCTLSQKWIKLLLIFNMIAQIVCLEILCIRPFWSIKTIVKQVCIWSVVLFPPPPPPFNIYSILYFTFCIVFYDSLLSYYPLNIYDIQCMINTEFIIQLTCCLLLYIYCFVICFLSYWKHFRQNRNKQYRRIRSKSEKRVAIYFG